MKSLNVYMFCSLLLLFSCTDAVTTQVADNTFVQDNYVYKIIDNEVTIIGDLKNDSIRRFQVAEPTLKDFGKSSLSFVKAEAYSTLEALYRGNTLYYIYRIHGLNDLKDNYSKGTFTIKFIDEFGFDIHSTEISTNQLVSILDNNETVEYEYNGKTKLSNDIYNSISGFDVTAAIRKLSKKSSSPWWQQ